jgi:hypothetical protein
VAGSVMVCWVMVSHTTQPPFSSVMLYRTLY